MFWASKIFPWGCRMEKERGRDQKPSCKSSIWGPWVFQGLFCDITTGKENMRSVPHGRFLFFSNDIMHMCTKCFCDVHFSVGETQIPENACVKHHALLVNSLGVSDFRMFKIPCFLTSQRAPRTHFWEPMFRNWAPEPPKRGPRASGRPCVPCTSGLSQVMSLNMLAKMIRSRGCQVRAWFPT